MSVILCTAGYDHTIRFWEALSGLCCRQIPHNDSQINRLCISPNKAFLAVAGRNKVSLYTCKIPEASHRAPTSSAQDGAQPVLVFEGHSNNITGVAFHADAKWMVTSSEDGTVKIWDTKTGTMQRNYNHGCPVNDVVIHPNQGELISCDRGGNVRIWDLAENKCSHQLILEHDVSVSSVTVAVDGSLLCAGNNTGNVYVWRLLTVGHATTITPECKFAAHPSAFITRVLLSPDTRQLATCSSDHTARIWRVELAETPDLESGTFDEIDGDTEDGSPATAAAAYKTANTDPALQHTHAQQVPADQSASHTSTTSTTTTHQSSTSNTNPTAPTSFTSPIHPITTTTPIHPITTTTPTSPTTSPTPPKTFPLEATLADHQRWVWDCAFSADSAYLVTACSDHYARLWDLAERTVIRQYQGHHRGLVCVALNDYSAT